MEWEGRSKFSLLGSAEFSPLVQSHPLTVKGYSAFPPALSRLEGSPASKAQAAIEKVCQDRPNEDTAGTNHATPEVP